MMKKKLISCLLVVMMLAAAASAFAESTDPVIKNDAVLKFINDTDFNTKDIALQIQSGEEVNDVVIRTGADSLDLVTRNGGVEGSHILFNPTGIYVGEADKVTLVRYDTLTTIVNDFAKEVVSLLEQIIASIPEEAAPTEAEIQGAFEQVVNLAAAEAAKEETDAVTLASAAASFASKFKPEYILDVKENDSSVEISLRSEAFASALAEAVDEMMENPALAKLVDQEAAEAGGVTFAEIQEEWAKYREDVLSSVASILSTEKVEDNGHVTSHFHIGEDGSEAKVLVWDSDSWIDEENDELQMTVWMGYENENPFMVYELAVSPYAYRERLTAGNSVADVSFGIENDMISKGEITSVIEGQEQLKAYFGPDYMYMKGPRGAISWNVRETWTGKTRYVMVAETAEGATTTLFLDFYEADDSLICELSTNQSERTVQFKISRIDKVNIEDLSASDKITEITVDNIYNELGNLLKQAVPALENAAESTAETAK